MLNGNVPEQFTASGDKEESYLTGIEADLAAQAGIEVTGTVIASGWSGYTTWKLTSDGVLTFTPTEQKLENGQTNMKGYRGKIGRLRLKGL